MPDDKFEWNEGHGGLRPNDKGDNPNRPDFRGNATVGGRVYELAGWKKTDKNGGTWLSVNFTDNGEAQGERQTESSTGTDALAF